MLLQFRMLSDEDDHFLRDYQLPPQMTLAELHEFICDDLGYTKENLASFFFSDDQWLRLREFTYINMDLGDEEEELPDENQKPQCDLMHNATLADMLRAGSRRLIYLFDVINDRALYLELTDAFKEKDGPANLLLANGEAPDQFDPEDSPANRSIFDEAMSDFDDFDGNDNYEEE